jgi:stage II sporulation protein D
VALSATVVALSSGPAVPAGAQQELTGSTVRFEPLAAGDGGLAVAGTGTFRGAIEVRRNGRALAVVNHLGLEEYVRGIDEVPPSWPAAALQAQAIAARTYAAYKALAGDPRWRELGADICATSTCQVYRGLDGERRAQGSGWLRAVEVTAGRALVEAGRPIMASYSSTANGPRAMSQNGALEMANAGRSANDILAAYYGLRPTVARATLPATIRVAVETSATIVRISAAGPFRVVDGTGAVLVTAAAGDWTVATGAGGVRLVPPEGWAPEPAARAAMPTPPAARVSPGRVLTAAAPVPASPPGRWPVAGAVLTLVAGSATITVRRRRPI